MAYLDTTGLTTFWNKIKATLAGSIGASADASGVTLTLKNKAATPAAISTQTVAAATSSAAGVMSAAQAEKLAGIATGAEVNVQADWNETDSTSDAYIANKPTIPEGAKLYGTTGQNTDGAMTQKATTDELSAKYVKPATGIPKSDLASGVQDSLELADSALQEHQSLAAYATLASPTFTGTPKAPTASSGTSTTQVATTAFVQAALPSATATAPKMDGTASVGTETAWAKGDHVHPTDTSRQAVISDLATIRSGASAGATAYQKPGTGIPKSDLADAVQTSLGKADTAIQSHQSLAAYATLASPTFTGTPAAPTAAAGTSTTQLATTAFVAAAVSSAAVGAAKYQGTLGSESALTSLTDFKQGYYWAVAAGWQSASMGIYIDKGDMLFANADGATFAAAKFDAVSSDIEAIPDSVIDALS